MAQDTWGRRAQGPGAAGAGRDPGLGPRRPYGGHTNQELTRLITTGPVDALREDQDAAAAEEAKATLLQEIADATAAGTSRGQIEVAPIYLLLDRADEHLAVAFTEQAREKAAAGVAAAADEHLRVLSAADDKGRLALRMAGTSHKEHRQLSKQAKERRAGGWQEAADARVAASRAAEAAWKAVRDSPHATVLGATPYTAPDVDTLAARLTEMREQRVPARAQQKDAGDQKRVARLHAQATTARESAAMYRTITNEARTEQTLRTRIAEQDPKLHESEVRARTELQRKAQEAQSVRIAAPEQPSDTNHPPRAAQAVSEALKNGFRAPACCARGGVAPRLEPRGHTADSVSGR
ncbi:hypothetical protein [Streptomyces sp. NPDC048462]|uniref:hypothetical protein n=1 Tax=Streptomyces sp. NPDC048462 TaxID=3365555 RepID=UPI0037183910